jgi:hypothetical protein
VPIFLPGLFAPSVRPGFPPGAAFLCIETFFKGGAAILNGFLEDLLLMWARVLTHTLCKNSQKTNPLSYNLTVTLVFIIVSLNFTT